jgi:hypothetical protein
MVKTEKKVSFKRVVIEKMSDCKLVRERRESNGHDCWGKSEYTSYDYVLIDDKEEKVFKGEYIIHDEESVFETGYLSLLDKRYLKYLDEEYFNKLESEAKESRYKKYLELEKEFAKDPIYSRDKKILEVISYNEI